LAEIQWDKDGLDAMGLLKVDILALGMLSTLRWCFDLGKSYRGKELQEDKPTYAMISRADTPGVFQIESRAQMAMLPRLGPQTFYDLVIEVAIVRPGPIQEAWSIPTCVGGPARRRSATRRRWRASSAGPWVCPCSRSR
jgi:DNA polymerase III alpha subunit